MLQLNPIYENCVKLFLNDSNEAMTCTMNAFFVKTA